MLWPRIPGPVFIGIVHVGRMRAPANSEACSCSNLQTLKCACWSWPWCMNHKTLSQGLRAPCLVRFLFQVFWIPQCLPFTAVNKRASWSFRRTNLESRIPGPGTILSHLPERQPSPWAHLTKWADKPSDVRGPYYRAPASTELLGTRAETPAAATRSAGQVVALHSVFPW